MCSAKVLQCSESDFHLLLCCVIADQFSVLLRCVHRVWLLILMGFVSDPLHGTWWLMGRPVTVGLQASTYQLAQPAAGNPKCFIPERAESCFQYLFGFPSETWQPFMSGHFREEVEMWFQCPSTVMSECDLSTHVIRFGIFSHRWQGKRKLAIFLCSLFVLGSFSKASFSYKQWDSFHGYYGGWLLSVYSIFFL